MWSDSSFYAWRLHTLTAKGICGSHTQAWVAGQRLRWTRQSVTARINYLLEEEYNTMLFSKNTPCCAFMTVYAACTDCSFVEFCKHSLAFTAPGSSSFKTRATRATSFRRDNSMEHHWVHKARKLPWRDWSFQSTGIRKESSKGREYGYLDGRKSVPPTIFYCCIYQ